MDNQIINKQEILKSAQEWFKETIAPSHLKRTKKLIKPNEFDINPFLTIYLAHFLTGNASPESIAKALVYPRVLGSSITTSFGQNIQTFTNKVFKSIGSTTPGLDIEFIDQHDKRKKYCQLKAGPNTINADGVITINNHFDGIKNRARTNNLNINTTDLIVGVVYGERKKISAHYNNIEKKYNYPVYVGKDFWYRLTGDETFYYEFIKALIDVASEYDCSDDIDKVISELAKTDIIQRLSMDAAKTK